MSNEIHPVWTYFAKLETDGTKISKCQFCYSDLSRHRAGNAKKHLRTRHGVTVVSETRISVDAEARRAVPNQLKRQIEELTHKVD